MREIKFRGKSGKKWYFGDLLKNTQDGAVLIVMGQGKVANTYREVDGKTIGQYTGLKDRNGKEIYEGDILAVKFNKGGICSIGDVQFDYGVFGVEWVHHKKGKTMVGAWGQKHNLRRLDDDIIDNVEVIGNIYDNSELIKE